MFVFVLSINGKPLMPTNPAKARALLKTGKAKVIRTTPFTIKLLYESEEYTQPVIAGMDTGSKKIGCAAISNNIVRSQSEIGIRDDISGKMQQRSMYRRNRRSRKTRSRPVRFDNTRQPIQNRTVIDVFIPHLPAYGCRGRSLLLI